ncbi:MAG: L-lactate dehydrogenase, partial [Actinomycetota bacterium]|nr:L-lactate dehydrogenase [Actinomycetota bacterium]
MAGLAVGIVGAGGVGVAAASALIMRGLAGRVTIYARDGGAAHGLALDFMHARPLLTRVEVRGRGLDEIEREDILIITAGHHTRAGETRLDILHQNIVVMDSIATSVEAGELPRVALVVTNPLDVMTEYLTRRWHDRPVSVMGSGTALETLRLTDRIARECGVHPRSVHAWVVGEHGDSCVFLLDSAVVGTLPLVEFAAQRGIELTPERFATIERDVRDAAYEVRDLKGAAVQGIGLTVSGLVHALVHEVGALIPVSV